MTRKDYIKIAAVLKDCRGSYDTDDITSQSVVDDVVNEMAGMLAADNPKFNRDKFKAACNSYV